MTGQRLHIQGEYPPDWDEIGDRVRAEAGHRCIRCGHPYKAGEHGRGEWSTCDEHCDHRGPFGALLADRVIEIDDDQAKCHLTHGNLVARWRVLTVHHLDGDKSNCAWWNLLSLCQRCHLEIQGRVHPHTPFFLEHSAWFKPYVAGFYAKKYEGLEITREEAIERMDELLKYERLA